MISFSDEQLREIKRHLKQIRKKDLRLTLSKEWVDTMDSLVDELIEFRLKEGLKKDDAFQG